MKVFNEMLGVAFLKLDEAERILMVQFSAELHDVTATARGDLKYAEVQ